MTPGEANAVLGDVVFLALPAVVFKSLSDEAAKRQLSLAELLGHAVSEYIKKPI